MMRALQVSFVTHHRHAMMIALFTTIILVIFFKCTALGMDWYAAKRYWYYAIPSVFSETYGAPLYTYFSEITLQLSLAYPFEDQSKFKSVFAAATNISDIRQSTVLYFPADEKGTVDFVRVAFFLFGIRIESIFYFYFLILVLSIAVFVFRFRNNLDALFIGIVVLASFYVAICTFPITKEVYSVTNPRAIGGLSMFALLHLALLTIRCETFSKHHVLEILFQSLVLVIVVSMRTAELWQLIALGTIAFYAIVIRTNKQTLAKSVGRLIPLLIALIVLGGHYVYQNRVYPAEYFNKNIRDKIFWHNVLIGFSLNPYFADKYSIDVSDTSVLKLMKTEVARRKPEDFEKIFWPEGKQQEGFVKDIRRNERFCEEAVWRIVSENPYQLMKLMLYYKPRQFLRSFAYAIGAVRPDLSYYSLADQEGSLLSPGERTAKSAFLNPFALVPILSILCGLGIVGVRAAKNAFDRDVVFAFVLIWLASLIPGFVTYPLIHVITGTYFTTTLLFYALLLSIGAVLYRRAQQTKLIQ